MRVLVTGANGYIGQGIVFNLLERGHVVIAADLNIDKVDNRAISLPCNLFDVQNPYEELGRPDILIHLAWRDGFNHYSQAHLIDLPLHYRFIKKAVESGIDRICIMGSVHEIGYYEGVVDEFTPTNPKNLYGISKNALRQSVDALGLSNKFEFLWMRGFYIVGNNNYGSSVFSKISEAARKGETEFPFTMGENQYDFIDYTELCRQVVQVSCKKGETGIINCCSGRPMKLKDRVEQFLEENQYNIKLQYGKFAERPYDSRRIWGDNARIMRLMGEK